MTVTTPKVYRLNDQEKNHLADELHDFKYVEGDSYEDTIRQARSIVASASAELDDVLHQVKNSRQPAGPMILKNLPFDDRIQRGLAEPDKPMPVQPSSLSEGLLLGVVARIGEPYAIQQESVGLISNLCPKYSDMQSFTGLGSRRTLDLHVENAAARLLPGDRAPDGLALIGRAKEKLGSPGTLVADGRLAVSKLSDKVHALLRDEDRFLAKFPERWRMDEQEAEIPTAIIYGSDHAPSFVAAFYGDMVRGVDPESESALQAFRLALESVVISVAIEPGTLVLIDNHFMFHGRSAFEPSFDKNGLPYRWLQRVFWTSALRRFDRWPVTAERIVHSLV